METFRPPAPLQFFLGNVKKMVKMEARTGELSGCDRNRRSNKHCSPRQNVVYERYKFFSCVPLEGQTIEAYVTQLKSLASTCEIAEQENGLVRDRIVLGIKDSGLQERLLRENNLNFEKASRGQTRNRKYDTATINFVKENQNKPKTQYNCKKCGRKHKPRECPAFGKICAKCKKKNHFAAKCFQCTKNIHEMNVPEKELVYIDSVNENETKCAMKNVTDSNFKNVELVSETTWYKNVSLDVNNKGFDVNFKLDTGAEVNILSLYILIMFKVNPKLSTTNISLTTYGNFNLKPNVSLIINCSTDKLKNDLLPFYVVNVKSKPILGLRGYNAVPVIHTPRRVPLASQPKLKSTLDRLEKDGIVSKVNKPTDWAREDTRDYLEGLMEYRNTPISGLDLSPTQMMFNHGLKTKLPMSKKLLNTELLNNIREKLVKEQNVQRIHYDKTAHPLPALEP
ncbi:uncharacterized protein TNCV_749341 [Trichonephila clavipes]|nr:uncharacterized protein TNCV_749341 [Trichonephila clavipes]